MTQENLRPSIEEFKARFAKTFRFSPYPVYDAETAYEQNDVVLWLSPMY